MRKPVKTKQANVVTYIRPLVKAITANLYNKPGQKRIVYSSIKGWFELRRVDKDGVRTAEFIRKEDITYGVGYLVISLIEYLRNLLKKAKYKKDMPETL